MKSAKTDKTTVIVTMFSSGVIDLLSDACDNRSAGPSPDLDQDQLQGKHQLLIFPNLTPIKAGLAGL